MSNLAVIFAAEDSGSGSFLVSPNVGLMIWTLVVFGLSMYLLGKLACPRIAEALDRRQKAIEDSIDAAEHTRAEAETMPRPRKQPARLTGSPCSRRRARHSR